MIVTRVGGCDCPRGNFYCEVYGCFRGIRTREQLERESKEEIARRWAENPHMPREES